MPNKPNITCAKCGGVFHCSAGENIPCWCASLPHIMPLKEASCLCSACLTEAIKEHQEITSVMTAQEDSNAR